MNRLILAFCCLTWLESVSTAEPQFLSIKPAMTRGMRSPSEIGLFEKFELEIDLRATFDNPFDPTDIDLSAEFTSPAGKRWAVWGFYNPSSWAALWMVRFSPTEIGTWTYVVRVKDRNGVATSTVRELTVVASDHPGFVTIAPNRRYLQYSDGSSFYGVGLWYNDEYINYGRGFMREAGLDHLLRNGANFISFYPTPLETMGTGLGRYDLSLAGRLDEIVQWCEQRGIHISWNLVFHSYISQAVWGGGNARYRNNPYHTIAPPQEYFRSPDVWRYHQQLNRYILARWGYSRAIWLWFVIDEINGTEGWQQGDQGAAETWCRKMHEFYREHDAYRRPTTGTQSGGIDEWWPGGYRIFDIAAREIYESQGHPMPAGGKPDPITQHPLRFSYRNYARQLQDLWRGFEKPVVIGECGWDHTYYEPGTPGYLAMYHNALWVSLANGACTTPFWWSYSPYLNDSIITGQLRSFRRFAGDIDFAVEQWQPVPIDITHGDAWGMKSDGLTFGWVVHPGFGIAKETITIENLEPARYVVRLYHTWRGQYIKDITVQVTDGTLRITFPETSDADGRAQHLGDDLAFTIVKTTGS